MEIKVDKKHITKEESYGNMLKRHKKEEEKLEKERLPIGAFVRDISDWHIVTCRYYNPEIFQATGLGKSGSYVMLKSEVKEIIKIDKPAIERVLGSKTIIWCDKKFKRMYVTFPPIYEWQSPPSYEKVEYSGPRYYQKQECIQLFDGTCGWSGYEYIGFPYQIANLVKLKEIKSFKKYKDILKEVEKLLNDWDNIKKSKLEKVRFFNDEEVIDKKEVYFGTEGFYKIKWED